ncbi:phage portal protein [Enterococcus sp. BWR-S5]|nr:phage portal protein [Enterococcus sp. BWR-S5]MBL1223727.1 phage portal protein [Enterococcus sp. BWR-S5]
MDNIFNKIATDVAMMKFKHVKVTNTTGDNGKNLKVMEWQEMSDLSQCLSISPNDEDTPIVFWSNVIRKLLQEQLAVVIPVYENGTLKEIRLVDDVVMINSGKITVLIDEESQVLEVGSVWIFENPKKNLSAQLNQITNIIDDNLKALSEKINEQSSTLKGLLKLPTTLADDELKQKAQDRVNNIMEVAANGEIGYLARDEDFEELTNTYGTASKEELEFLKLQLYQAFGINEKLFTCDYTEDQYRAYYQSVVKVYLRVIEEEIYRKYFSKTARTQGQRLFVYIDLFDIASLKDLNNFAYQMKYSGIMNANELREILGYAEFEGGEVFESNKNAVPIGTAQTEEKLFELEVKMSQILEKLK